MSRDRFLDLQHQESAGPEHIRLISEGGNSLARSPRPLCIDSLQVTQTCTTESRHLVYPAGAGACTVIVAPDSSLFSVPSEHAELLDQGSIPDLFRSRFDQHKTPLSDTPCLIIQHPGRLWFLTDHGRKYSIRKLSAKLSVFVER
jgi:hypothetical protein